MTMIVYKFLATTRASDISLPASSLGIEATMPEVANQCHLGNLDGQHWDSAGVLRAGLDYNGDLGTWEGRFGYCHDAWEGSAAIELACRLDPFFSYTTDGLPLEGTTLITCRPDLDSVGTMAILLLRKLGLVTTVDLMAGTPFRSLVDRIAQADKFSAGGVWRAMPLPTVEHPWPISTTGSVDSTQELVAINAICGDRKLSLEEKVAITALWLLGGDEVVGQQSIDVAQKIVRACGLGYYIDDYDVKVLGEDRYLRPSNPPKMINLEMVGDILQQARARAEQERVEMVDLLSCGFMPTEWLATENLRGFSGRPVEVRCTRTRDPREIVVHTEIAGDPSICSSCGSTLGHHDDCPNIPHTLSVVESTHRGALSVGYCLSPVVLAMNPAFTFQDGTVGRKFTLCRWNTTFLLRWGECVAALNALEPGGGGSPTIWGSRQAGPSDLTLEQVKAVILAHLG